MYLGTNLCGIIKLPNVNFNQKGFLKNIFVLIYLVGGFNLGGGFKTDSGISLGVRYHLGMGDLYDEGKAQNRVWHFSIGFDL